MSLELSRIWFEEQLQRLADGARRMAELNSLPWRFPGKRGKQKQGPRPAPPGLRQLAREAVSSAGAVDDWWLLSRAALGFTLRPAELRRAEYLAIKLTGKEQAQTPEGSRAATTNPEAISIFQEAVEGDVNTGRKSEPAVIETRGRVSPAAGRGSVLVQSSRRQEAREMATPARFRRGWSE